MSSCGGWGRRQSQRRSTSRQGKQQGDKNQDTHGFSPDEIVLAPYTIQRTRSFSSPNPLRIFKQNRAEIEIIHSFNKQPGQRVHFRNHAPNDLTSVLIPLSLSFEGDSFVVTRWF